MSVTPDLEGLGDLPRIDYEVRAFKFTEYDEQGILVNSCEVPAGAFVIRTVFICLFPLLPHITHTHTQVPHAHAPKCVQGHRI